MTPDEFSALADQGYNRIPLVREVLADLDTPLSAYLKLAEGPHSYLFESVQGGEKWGRYSIIGLPCRCLVRVSGQRVAVERDGALVESTPLIVSSFVSMRPDFSRGIPSTTARYFFSTIPVRKASASHIAAFLVFATRRRPLVGLSSLWTGVNGKESAGSSA